MSNGEMMTESEYMKPQWTKMPDASKRHVFATYRDYCIHRDDTGAWDVGQRNLALYKRLRSRPREAWRDGQCPFGHVSVDEVQVSVCICTFICMYVCMYVYMYVYMYVCACVFIGHHCSGARLGAVCMWEPAPTLVTFRGHDATSDSWVS